MGHIQQPIYCGHRPPRAKGSLLSLPGARYYPVHTLRAESNDQESRLTTLVFSDPLLNACETFQTSRMNSKRGLMLGY